MEALIVHGAKASKTDGRKLVGQNLHATRNKMVRYLP